MLICHRRCIGAHVVLIVAVAASWIPCFAQPAPDPSRWEPALFNPGGERVVPIVYYDSTTGILGLDTRGLNRIKDTPDYTVPGGPIVFDDVGFVYFSVLCPITGGTFLPPFDQEFDPVQVLVYNGFYSGGRYTLLVQGVADGRFLWPGVYSVLQLPTGLDASAFPLVELAVNFGPQLGVASFSDEPNRVQVVPEPSVPLTILILFNVGCMRRCGRDIHRSTLLLHRRTL